MSRLTEHFTSPILKARFAISAIAASAVVYWLIAHQDEFKLQDLNDIYALLPIPLFYGLLCQIGVYALRLWRLFRWSQSLTQTNFLLADWIKLYARSIAIASITPMRLGDFTRVTMLDNGNLTLAARAKLVALEKVCDAIVIPISILITITVVAHYIGIPPSISLTLAALSFIAFALAIETLKGDLPTTSILFGVTLSIISASLFLLSNYFLFVSAGISLSPKEVVMVVVSAGVIANIPISMNGLGVREASFLSLLTLLSVNQVSIARIISLEFFTSYIFPFLLYAAIEAIYILFNVLKANKGSSVKTL